MLNDSWASTRWAERQVQLRLQPVYNVSLWSIALSIEQLTSVSDNGTHETLLLVKVNLAEGVGTAPTSAFMQILFSRQVQPAYICLPSIKWLPELDLHQHYPD